MKKSTPTLKKVKIDEIIKQSNSASGQPIKRGRGRPRKNPQPDNQSSAGERKPYDGQEPKLQASLGDQENQMHFSEPEIIEPIYDTSAEARGILQTPFALVASFLKMRELALSDLETDALMPSWKPVYDQDVRPLFGEHTRLIAFAGALSEVLIRKVIIVTESRNRSRVMSMGSSDDYKPENKPAEMTQ